jgi:hypothetical protein
MKTETYYNYLIKHFETETNRLLEIACKELNDYNKEIKLYSHLMSHKDGGMEKYLKETIKITEQYLFKFNEINTVIKSYKKAILELKQEINNI